MDQRKTDAAQAAKGVERRRGFVTIATGDQKYYQMALNLLRSYRVNGGCELPFALICDRDCSIAREFDEMVLISNPCNSYLDKLYLNRYAPYEETIFIDADILILNNIEILWEDFAPMDDFCCYGRELPLESREGWFYYKDMGELQDRIPHGISMHGGVYYLRKTKRCDEIFDIALEITKHYHEYKFYYFKDPADEPILALAMVLASCKPCPMNERIAVLPAYEGRLRISAGGELMLGDKPCDSLMLHFASRNTKRFLYQYLVQTIKEKQMKGEKAVSGGTRCLIWIKCLPYEVKFILNRIRRKMLPALMRHISG